ncbi:MAG: aldose 1-epimerase family protein [Sediminibacterium sp.]|nr:MAG: aldose [Chitinophagaceae bacterium]MDP1843766.1 aldose 1-epimerase family protein [Sediminibacterium sp.]
MIHLENNHVSITVNPKGAELQSIYCKDTALEYLWSGDAAFWGKKSPVLFPIVGGLKNNTYKHNGTAYQLGRHGFARDMEFTLTAKEKDSISFTLNTNDNTLQQYPFLFHFVITYSLHKNVLTCTYQVTNVDIQPLFFSVGAHPAFKVPLVEGTSFEDYYLLFNAKESAGKWPLTPDGLIDTKPVPFFNNNNRIELNKPLFYGDALVFKGLQSTSIALQSNQTKHGFTFSYSNFPFMGIWSAKNADFVCIEPWCGIADSVDANGELRKKEGIHLLTPGEVMSRSWSVTLY